MHICGKVNQIQFILINDNVITHTIIYMTYPAAFIRINIVSIQVLRSSDDFVKRAFLKSVR